MSFKRVVKSLLMKQYSSSDAYTKYLCSNGAKIGQGTFFYAPEKKPVDESALPFLEIGNNCRITDDVVFLLHDYSYAALRPVHHAMLRKAGVIRLGNNVFVGTRSIILMNTIIGDNVVIGAGSVVSGRFDSNVVIAGNPAKVVCTLDEYYRKCLNRFEDCARLYYIQYSKYYGRPLSENEMSWYVALWKTNDQESRIRMLEEIKIDGDNKYEVIRDVMNFKPVYNSYKEFLTSFKHEL